MTRQELSDGMGERVMCPHVGEMERAHRAEVRARQIGDMLAFGVRKARFMRNSDELLAALEQNYDDAFRAQTDPYVWHDLKALIDG